jgi:hypothetical protein
LPSLVHSWNATSQTNLLDPFDRRIGFWFRRKWTLLGEIGRQLPEKILSGLAAASGFAPLGISEAFHPAVILSIQNQISSAEATDIAAVLLRSPFWPWNLSILESCGQAHRSNWRSGIETKKHTSMEAPQSEERKRS